MIKSSLFTIAKNKPLYHKNIQRFETLPKPAVFKLELRFWSDCGAEPLSSLSFGEHPAKEQIQAIVSITERNKAIAFLTISEGSPGELKSTNKSSALIPTTSLFKVFCDKVSHDIMADIF